MNDDNTDKKLLAHVLYDIRLLLANYLGQGKNRDDIDIRTAAHLAYAVHNDALAVIEGKPFDVSDTLKRIRAIDKILDIEEGERLCKLILE